MSLSKLQQEILDNDDPVIFVDSSAAAGKTRMIVAKIQKELDANKGKVVAFTFTNAAAEEIRERIKVVDKDNLFIGTIHSYCVYLLLRAGYDEVKTLCDKEDFDGFFELIQKYPNAAEPVYCTLCDEMQDCDEDQFNFIFNIIKSKKYFCCYDKKQSIFRWRGARPELLRKYIEEKNATVLSLNENYRNCAEILEYAKNIIRLAGRDYIDNSIAMRKDKGKVYTNRQYNLDAIVNTIRKMTQENKNYCDWFILARTNDQLQEVARVLKRYNLPYATFKKSEFDNKELAAKMKENTIKLLTIHTAKGLEAKNVIVIGARFYNLEEKCISYVAATRAKEMLVWVDYSTKPMRDKIVSNWED